MSGSLTPASAPTAATATAPAASRPLRIMLVTQFYPPVIGGVEVHVRGLAQGLAARGHDVLVATHVAPGSPLGERRDGPVRVVAVQGAVQRIGPLFTTERRHAIPLADPGVTSALRELARDFDPDVVHAHNWMGRSYVPLAREFRARYLVSLHDSGRICTQGRMFFRNAEPCTGPSLTRCLSCCAQQFGALKGTVTYAGNRLARGAEARAVDLFLPVSHAVAASNRLAADGLAFEVVPNFSAGDEGASGPNDARLTQLPSAPFILQVGDVVADKGVDVLLAAYRTLADPPPLVLIGRIADDVAAALPAGVTAVGPWPHELVLEAWRGALLGTIPSLCLDACPTVTFEAMAAGVPVVGSAIGGLTDQVVDGESGLLVPPGDVTALANAIERLAGDAHLRARLGEAASARFRQNFTAEVVSARLEAIYLAQRELGDS